MPKMKSHSGTKKRFRKTGTGNARQGFQEPHPEQEVPTSLQAWLPSGSPRRRRRPQGHQVASRLSSRSRFSFYRLELIEHGTY